MTTIVMGGGLIGVTSAYYLARAGHQVRVLERNAGAGEETSFQNGALLAPGHSHSWAAPGALWTLLKSLLQKDPALRFRLSRDPQFWRWALAFLANCTHADYRANTLRTFHCMYQGLQGLRELCADTGIDYDGNDHGILYLFRSEYSLAARSADWDLLRDHGLRLETADAARCVAIEPALEHAQARIGGGFWSPDEGAGDAFVFTRRLAEHCAELGVSFDYDTEITGLSSHLGRVSALHTRRGDYHAERYLLALGPWAARLAASVGLRLPIWPVKGYTASIPIASQRHAPRVGVIEEDNLVAFANLGDRLRCGGKAEFAGYDKSFRETDFRGVLAVAQELFPRAGDYTEARRWACLRPVTAAGPPLLGETTLDNLFINVGHGAAGWTQCCATGAALAQIMSGRKPELDMTGLRLADL